MIVPASTLITLNLGEVHVNQGVGVHTTFSMLFENISVDYFMARAQFKLPTMLFFSVYRYFVCPLTHGARSHLV